MLKNKNVSISVYAIFNDQSFNETITNDIVSFEQLGPENKADNLTKWCYNIIFHTKLICTLLGQIKQMTLMIFNLLFPENRL